MREIKTIEVDRWEPSEKKGMVKHVGMISPQEAFDVLETHLKSVGLLPDEYFLSGARLWGDLHELPDYFRADCSVNWGGSEGIYLDIDLRYYDEEQNLCFLHLATGKTLGETGDDFLRMSRIAAECSMLLNGRGEIVRFYEEEKGVNVMNFDYSVFSWSDIDKFPYQVADLVATFEELNNVPVQELVTEYFGNYGQHFFKSAADGVTSIQISEVLNKALNAIEMSFAEFIEKKGEFVERGKIKAYMKNKAAEPLDNKIMAAAEEAKDSVVSHRGPNKDEITR